MPDVEYLESTGDYDQYTSALAILSKYNGLARTLFMRRKRDLDRNIIESCHSNPLLDTRIYEFYFQDGSISKYAANRIAENLY